MVIRAAGSVGIAGIVDGRRGVAGGRGALCVIARVGRRVVGGVVGGIWWWVVGRIIGCVCVGWGREVGGVVGRIVGVYLLVGRWREVVRLREVA